jgi:hypothetical protein
MYKIHSRYILKLMVQESPVQKPDHAQIQLLQPYLFVTVLLTKLHYRMVLHFLASWSFITIFRLALILINTLHLPNKYPYTLTHKPNVWNTPNAASPCTHSRCPNVTLQRQWRTYMRLLWTEYLQQLATLNMVDSNLYNFCSYSLSFSVGGRK